MTCSESKLQLAWCFRRITARKLKLGLRALSILLLLPLLGATTQPADNAQIKTIDLPILVSPDAKEYAPGEDQRITQLIERHNAREDRLGQVSLVCRCLWNLEGTEGQPRQMRIEYNRATVTAEIVCGTDTCQVRGGRITASAQSLVHSDGFYLLLFRKYNPKGFRPAANEEIGGRKAVVATSAGETLAFDAPSGRLLRAAFQTKAGPVTAYFADFIDVATDEGKIEMPTKVWVSVPDEYFPEGWADHAKITMLIDAGQSRIIAQP